MRLTAAAVCLRQRGEIDDATGAIRNRRSARHLVAVSADGQLRDVEMGGAREFSELATIAWERDARPASRILARARMTRITPSGVKSSQQDQSVR